MSCKNPQISWYFSIPKPNVCCEMMYKILIVLCFRIFFFFFFNIMTWDLLAKEKTSEAQTSCKKLRCFLPVDTPSWDLVVPRSAQLPGSVQAPGSMLQENAATASRSPVVTLPSYLLHGPLVLARRKLKDPCPTLPCTAQTCIFDLGHLGDVVCRAAALCSSPSQTYNLTVLPFSTMPGSVWQKYLHLCSASVVQD